MDRPYRVGDVDVLPTHLDLPGVGTLTVNCFVLHSDEPVLVDTGLGVDGDAFIEALRSVIDPADLRWIWLTHDDADHTGNIAQLMELAPQAKLATHALAALRMATWWPAPLDRVHALVVGDQIDVGDRTLTAVRPPTFDNPTSTGILDPSTQTLFSVDTFGAILPGYVESLDDVPESDLTGGMIAWATFDSPWTHLTDRVRFDEVLDEVHDMNLERIFSAHSPAATGRVDQFLKVLSTVPDAEPFVPPGAEAFQQIVAQMGPPPA
jgi:glyoxylase-like metal-dependent hydrolase (beta-lactamase superfamily II)